MSHLEKKRLSYAEMKKIKNTPLVFLSINEFNDALTVQMSIGEWNLFAERFNRGVSSMVETNDPWFNFFRDSTKLKLSFIVDILYRLLPAKKSKKELVVNLTRYRRLLTILMTKTDYVFDPCDVVPRDECWEHISAILSLFTVRDRIAQNVHIHVREIFLEKIRSVDRKEAIASLVKGHLIVDVVANEVTEYLFESRDEFITRFYHVEYRDADYFP